MYKHHCCIYITVHDAWIVSEDPWLHLNDTHDKTEICRYYHVFGPDYTHVQYKMAIVAIKSDVLKKNER